MNELVKKNDPPVSYNFSWWTPVDARNKWKSRGIEYLLADEKRAAACIGFSVLAHTLSLQRVSGDISANVYYYPSSKSELQITNAHVMRAISKPVYEPVVKPQSELLTSARSHRHNGPGSLTYNRGSKH